MDAGAGFGLRSRTIGEILDLVFRVYRQRFALFAGIGIAQSFVGLFMGLAWGALIGPMGLERDEPAAAAIVVLGAGTVLLVLAVVIARSLGVLAATVVVEDALFGRPSSVRSILANVLPRTLAAAWTAILVLLLVLAGLVLCCFPGVAIAIVIVFSVPLCYLERLTGISALGRSYELVIKRGPRTISSASNQVRVFVIGLVVIVILYALNILANAPLMVLVFTRILTRPGVQNTILGPQIAPLYLVLPLQVLGAFLQGLVAMIGVIPWPLLYYDIRTRYEGLDLEVAVQALGAPAAGGAPLPAGP